MQLLLTVILVIVGIIHMMPALGMFGVDRLFQLYGLEITELNLLILMRHRAVLFGILGSYFILAAFKPEHQWIAILFGLISTSSFLVFTQLSEMVNQQLKQVFNIDAIAIGLLLIAVFLKWRLHE